MDSVPGADRIDGRMKAIEARMHSLEMEFRALEGMTGPPPSSSSSFMQTLSSERMKSQAALLEARMGRGLSGGDTDGGGEDGELMPDNLAALFQSLKGRRDSSNLKDLMGDIKDSQGSRIREWAGGKSGKIGKLGPFAESDSIPDSLRVLLERYQNSERGRTHAADSLAGDAVNSPGKVVKFEDYSMQARTAFKFRTLKEVLKQVFPGRGIYITSTMGGQHVSPAHPDGRAIDFVIDNLTAAESQKVEKLAKDMGFHVYNEYIYDSPYKTGDHMHIEL